MGPQQLSRQPQQPALAAHGLAAVQTADAPPARLHPDDLAQLASLVAEQVADFLAGEVATGKQTAQEAPPAPGALLTVKEVLAARSGITRWWLYAYKADCRAIRKNKSLRSPLWFRLVDVDAELDRRRTKPVKEAVEPPVLPAPRRRRARRGTTAGSLTANGAPRSFDVRPRRAA